MIASNAPRWSIRGGPCFGGSYSSRIGSISAHKSSEHSQIGGSGFLAFFGRPIRNLPLHSLQRQCQSEIVSYSYSAPFGSAPHYAAHVAGIREDEANRYRSQPPVWCRNRRLK